VGGQGIALTALRDNRHVDWLYSAFGVGMEPRHLRVSQVCLRAILIFFAALCIVRIADKRFFAKKTAFDVILGFILGSMLARAIDGAEPLIPTITAGFGLALLHRFLGFLACRFPKLGGIIKGHSQILIEEGRVNHQTLVKHHIGEDDLLEELRLNGVGKPSEAKLAHLERSGEVSVIKK
jgi:uncharacterized membrane protein YcaP (DUF421 family)